MHSNTRPNYGFYILGFLLGVLLFWLSVAHADPATHRLPDQQRKMQVWFGDMLGGYVVNDCLPTGLGTLTLTAFACEGYVKDLATGELLYAQQNTAAVGPLTAGNGTYWIGLRRNASLNAAGCTEQLGTLYVWCLSATQPALQTGVTLFSQVTVAGGAITAVADISTRVFTTQIAIAVSMTTGSTSVWIFAPGGSVTVSSGVTVSMGTAPTVIGAPRQVFFGAGVVRAGNDRPSSPHWWGAQGDDPGDGTGTDDTAAFNLATQATVPWVAGIRRTIRLESGLTYKLGSTVYVRAGQTLTSAGGQEAKLLAASGTVPTLLLGDGLISGVETADPSGIVPSVENLLIESTPTGGFACIKSRNAGYFIRHLQIVSCALGMDLRGADGIVSDILIDQGLVGAYIGTAQNLTVSNISIFNTSYGVLVDPLTYDVQLSNFRCEYAKINCLLFRDGVGPQNFQVHGMQALLNEQYASFLGFIAMRATGGQATIANAAFRNMKGAAIRRSLGGMTLTCRSCDFDGNRTNLDYAQSSDSAGIDAEGITLYLENTNFRNLTTAAIAVGNGGPVATAVNWNGGYVANVGSTTAIVITNTNATSSVQVGNITLEDQGLYNAQGVVPVIHTGLLHRWFAPPVASGGRLYWSLPYQVNTSYLVTVSANINPGGNTQYRKSGTYGISKQNGFNGATPLSYAELVTVFTSSVTDILPVLDVQVDFATPGAGGTSTLINAGTLAVSVPNTYQRLMMTAQQLVTNTLP